jgi:hypothetical protein
LAYVVHSSINTRTSHSVQVPRLTEQAKHEPSWRAFQATDQEYTAQVQKKRDALRANWPSFKPLAVPSAYAYAPTALFTASTDFKPFVVTEAQRTDAIAALPPLAEKSFNRQAFDTRRSWAFTFIKRPGYYAAFTSGKPQARQTFGLGLLWHPEMGTLVQGVAGTPFVCGTLAADGKAPSESSNVAASLGIGGKSLTPSQGWKDLPAGDLRASYPLEGSGTKNVTFAEDRITIAVERPGAISEWLPLVLRESDQVRIDPDAVRITRDAATFTIRLHEGVKATMGESAPVSADLPRRKRILLKLDANDRLGFVMEFSGGN